MAAPEGTEEDVELARALLAEWNEGRGTSKSEIERREWGDGGAHGRRFDRFIRQALGVLTTQPSKQTGRIATLEAQLRRHGVTPAGEELADWEASVRHCCHAAMAALRAWNDPTASFRTESFALQFVAAWNGLAIAILQHTRIEWRDLDSNGAPVTFDGREKAKDTPELVSLAWPGTRHDPLRRNVAFWVGLRNHVAHRHLPTLDAAVIPQAQAGLLNLEGALVDAFGEDYTLGDSLSVPLQLSGFRNPELLASLKQLQGSLPLDVQQYLSQQARVNQAVADDPSYMLRVTFVPVVPSSGRNPDAVAYFVRPGEVTEDLGLALKDYVIMEKIVHGPRPTMIATQVVEAVRDRIPFRFTVSMHTEASRRLGARPKSSQGDQTATDARYCEYVTSVKRHLYNQAWVNRLASELSTADGFRAATGFEPASRQ